MSFDEVLISGATQDDVDEGGDVADIEAVILVNVGCRRCSHASHQNIDQSGHVADIHAAVAVHIAAQEGTTLLAEVPRVARAAVDVGIGLVLRVGGTVGRALAAHQAVAYVEYIRG